MTEKIYADKIFAEGMNFQLPTPKTPDFVKGRMGVKVEQFYAWARDHKDERGWINLDVCVSRGGNTYIALNTYKKTADGDDVKVEKKEVDDVPF